MMDLFLDKKLAFEKLGHEALMGEDPNQWPQQILDQLYKQAPFTSDYSPKVVLDTVDADRRYAMGRVELMNRLAINPRDDSTPPEMLGRQKTVLPVVIRDGKLSPMDILLVNGEVEPLTEDRLRTALFRPALFDSIRKRPGDLSMVEQLYPPTRQYGGARGPLISDVGGSGAGGVEKASSAKPEFLMDAILPTIKKAHVEQLTQQLNADPSLRVAVFSNEAVVPFMAKLAEVEAAQKDPETYLQKVAHTIRPTVIQVRRVDGGFLVKTANPDALAPTQEMVPRPEATGALGGDLVSKVEADGTTTINTQPAQKETLTDLEIKVADSFGLYKVKAMGDNRELVGWVFPKVMAFTGEVLPISLFGNGSEAAMQEAIAGVPVAKQTDLIDSQPQGNGCFYFNSDAGAVAFVPVLVRSQTETPEGAAYDCETVMGEYAQISKVPGLQEVSEIGPGHYGIPAECGFMPLENLTELASAPEEYLKTAMARMMKTAVRVSTDGVAYKFEGQPIDKLAGVMPTEFLDLDDAVFLAAVLGQQPGHIKTAFNKLRQQGQYEMWFDARPVHTLKEKYAEAKSAAHKTLSGIPDLRVDLMKEAAPLEDPTAVDKILSVGFLNPENISIFASYIPEIECTIKKLAELLLASRLGLNSVDQGALQKALVHLDKVVAGLKTLGTTPQA
jgi:hypothetical protein